MDTTAAARTVRLDRPRTADAVAMWRTVRESGRLDPNSLYFYLLWCRDFADSSVAAHDDSGRLIGFVTGFRRPTAPGTLFIWQIAVGAAHRRSGLGSQMVDHLVEAGEARPTALEASVTPDNTAAAALFDSFARRHGAPLRRRTLFGSDLFPDAHDAEELLRIDLDGPR